MEFNSPRTFQWSLLFLLIGWAFSELASGKAEDVLPARCSLFGKEHIQTFDGTLYDFPGDCSYMLAGDCQKRSFSLLGDYHNGQRKGVTVFLGEFFELHLSLEGAVTQGETRLSLPYASNGVFVELELGYYKLWSEEYGFVVRIDSTGNINVVLSEEHFNNTCGLCGTFNGIPADDYMAQEGFLTDSSYDFANSWALHGAGEPCRRVSPPSQTCNVSSEAAEELMSRCGALRNSPVFLRCAHVIDPEPFASLCEQDVCHCGSNAECQCQAFLEYSRSCAFKGVILQGWQRESQCAPTCPLGMVYSDCTSPCAIHTCQGLNINEVCQEECVDGCTCPPGKVLDGDSCVEASRCTCVHTSKRYPPGSSIAQDCNTCVCRHGLWECSNEDCPGECFVTGQSHFKSFDNKFFTFSGTCQYLFAKDCQSNLFSAVIETVQCADDQDAVCTRSATLRFHEMANMTIKMKHGGVVSVDGMDIQTPLAQGPLRIQKTVMSSVRLAYNDDFQVDWDGRGKLLLKLGPVFAGKTCGLCGNYNGNQGDDFMTAAGLEETQVEDFGNAWKLNGDCRNMVKQDADPCILNPKRVRYAEESCSVLLSAKFEPCHYEVNPAPFVKNCRYDVCSCSDGKECLCSAVSSYATACARKGVVINWRSAKFCDMSCPEDQVYEQCGSPCNQTCRSLSLPDTDCRDLCMEGCFCPQGLYVTDTGECVDKTQCSCYHDGEIYQPNDIFSDHSTICYCEDGAMRCSSNEVPGAMLSDLLFNDLVHPRVRRSLTCRPPMSMFVCSSHRDEGTECTKTCQNYDLECVSPGCVSGCMCPAGTVRYRNYQCLSPELCPCFHNGKEYSPGQTISSDCNTCVCRNRKWECSQRVCDGSCQAIGESHYLTFDGLKYTFPGLCQYVLAQDHCNGNEGTFRILVENGVCGGPGQKCSKIITVVYKGGVIEMAHGEVNMQKPVVHETEVEIIKSGLFYIVLLGKDLSVTWDRGTRIIVQLKGHYREKVCGLCGNFDGNQNNDLLSSNNQLEVEPADFGNSWKVQPSCADASQVPSQCSDNVMKLVSVEQTCLILTSELFKQCNSVVNPEPYWEICTHDTCSCKSIGDCTCFCDVIAAYAHKCAQRGVVIHWRSNSLCPLSCQELNKAEPEFECEWRYNTCAPACPVTCQHPEPLPCPKMCVEGCHATCPPGKILDEVAMRCVEPGECRVCLHEGRRVAHGKKIILNHEIPELCQICHCENDNLTCERCPVEIVTTTAAYVPTTPTPEPFSTPVPEEACDRAMDLAFLVDGSSYLSEADFEAVKRFIITVMEQFRMGSAHTRATILQFHSGVKSYEMQVQKRVFKKMVRGMKYSGGETAFMDEALKYLAVFIYDKDKREHAERVAVLLTASTNPRSMKTTQRLLKKKAITTVTIGLGPDVSTAQINEITKASKNSRAYILNSVDELDERTGEITNYMCTLGLTPLVPKPPTKRPPVSQSSSTGTPVGPTVRRVTSQTPPPTHLALTMLPSLTAVKDLTFVIEGSDKVGEENFNKTREFLEKVITELPVGEETIRITIVQYSFTTTIEYSYRETQEKTTILDRVRKMQWHGGNATNTGKAVQTVSESTFTKSQGGRDQVPKLVFLVTSNTPTDKITRHTETSDVQVFPIGVGPSIREIDLEPLSHPRRPLIVPDYTQLQDVVTQVVHQAVLPENYYHTTTTTSAPAPMTTLSPSVPCDKPMDVIFILKESSDRSSPQFEDMKTFVKAFINKANIGPTGTQVSVLQYGDTNTIDVTWRDRQSRENLVRLVDAMSKRKATSTRLGAALHFAVQNAISSGSGGRPGVAKIAVIIVTDMSQDPVEQAANEALTAGLSVFPIGVGTRYDKSQLATLAGHNMESNILHLNHMDDLVVMVTLGHTFIDKLCRAGPPGKCIDDDGNERKPGETWVLSDKCHSLLCHPNGIVTIQSHNINCERMERPTCKNNLRSVKIEEPCGCRWACPCMCMGSSTNHVVTFDGLAFKLNGFCSYALLQDIGQGIEIILHNGQCEASPNQICMRSIEVKAAGVSLVLHDDMKVTLNGMETPIPITTRGMEVNQYGAIMHRVGLKNSGHIVTFTPRNNEFTIQLGPTEVSNKTSGLCGYCDQDELNDFTLRDGSITTESSVFIKEWTVQEPWGTSCETLKVSEVCTQQASDQCQILQSSLFARCRKLVSPAPFLALCKQSSCSGGEICDVVSAYSHLCRLQGICVNWRSTDFCAMPCPSTMVLDSCRTGCVEECDPANNTTLCMEIPTEGCFCPRGSVFHNGACVSKQACSQCVDEEGVVHQHLDTWVPSRDACQICMCLDNRQINCTSRPCSSSKEPVCGPCEVLREKRGPQCCTEYECVCDLVTCDLPAMPKCGAGLTVVLTNPGECKPVYECACKKEECLLQSRPSCPSHRRLEVKKTQCCDEYECVCSCQNSTITCPLGYITTTVVNDCGCSEVSCVPDKVCVHSGVAYHVGNEWEDSCKTCSCTDRQDRVTGLHIVECTEKVCNEICPLGSTYMRAPDACCGRCKTTSCLENVVGRPMGDMDVSGRLRMVGEKWRSPQKPCVINECVRINEEVFINQYNVSCTQMDTPKCPLGTELRCNNLDGCCPTCQCVPLDACVMNNTIIGAGESLMVDLCTHCECSMEQGLLRRFRLSCKRITCTPCPLGYRFEQVTGSCCGKCIATSCTIQLKDGTITTLKANETRQEGCFFYTCKVNKQDDLVLETKITTCPPFDKASCLAEGGKVTQLGNSCCETCTEPECKKTAGVLKYIKIDDCMSRDRIDIHYCEGKCTSKSVYSLETHKVEKQCVCCSAKGTETMLVPLQCANGTVLQHEIFTVTACDCLSHRCEGE
ncbi:von Willebrand factor [Lepisosteus oculatus]|uniref:von Willebrand factor n=1 Tax=Lepisosteus oculatus TaxID=7918 RepID=UPI003719CF07